MVGTTQAPYPKRGGADNVPAGVSGFLTLGVLPQLDASGQVNASPCERIGLAPWVSTSAKQP